MNARNILIEVDGENDLMVGDDGGAFSLQKTSRLSSAQTLGSPDIVIIGFPEQVVPE